jgi:hypothetical protein
MAEVRKAYAEDFENIYPLLGKMDGYRMGKETWKKLFIRHWGQEEDYFGWVLDDNGSIGGYLGAIFSTRLIDGKLQKFCNLSTWIIDEKYRKQGLSLFLPVLALEDYTVTNFSSADKTYIISKKLGFEDTSTEFRLITPSVFSAFGNSEVELVFEKEAIRKILNEADLKIFEDHLKFNALQVVLKKGNDYSFLVLKKAKADLKSVYYLNRIFQLVFRTDLVRRNAMVGQIHYLSNKPLFAKYYQAATSRICLKYGLLGLFYNKSYLAQGLAEVKDYKVFATPIFKSAEVKPAEVDSLYSEYFLLDL